MAEIDAQVAELQTVRAELARVVERYPAAACHDPTATSGGVRPPSPRRGGERHGVLVLRLPLPWVAVLMLWLPVPGVPALGRR
jgi:hypothetical protein